MNENATRSDLQNVVLAVLAAAAEPMQEGEIKEAMGRSWSLYPTLRALRRRGLIESAGHWSYQLATPRPTLTLIQGGDPAVPVSGDGPA